MKYGVRGRTLFCPRLRLGRPRLRLGRPRLRLGLGIVRPCLQCYLDLEVTLELLDAAGAPVPIRAGGPCPSNRQFCVEADPDAEQTSLTKDFRDPGRDNEVFGLSFLYWPNVALPTPKARVRVFDRLADKETVQTIELPASL